VNRWLSDATLAHLRGLDDAPDFSATRYRLVGTLGAGGMGSIFLAEDRDLERPVAIKVLHGGSSDPQLAARLLLEARILAQLEHPGIVPVHAIGTLPDGRVYYVMKRVRGVRLDTANDTLSRAAKLGIFQRICEAVAFAHAAGVVHRDLKPENIMVGEFGEVLVLDWGVAKRLTEVAPEPPGQSAKLPVSVPQATSGEPVPPATAPPGDDTGPTGFDTRDGTLLGTPAYMAPEQRRGEVHRIDARTDVWALGGVLYFLLTGKAPVLESGSAGEPVADADFRVVPPRRVAPGVPRPLDALCMRAMAPAIESRYAGVEPLRAEVARFQAGERVEADPETLLRRATRLAVRYRVPLLVLGTYLVVRALLLVTVGR
jgi:serine/threonine protein kinase